MYAGALAGQASLQEVEGETDGQTSGNCLSTLLQAGSAKQALRLQTLTQQEALCRMAAVLPASACSPQD